MLKLIEATLQTESLFQTFDFVCVCLDNLWFDDLRDGLKKKKGDRLNIVFLALM